MDIKKDDLETRCSYLKEIVYFQEQQFTEAINQVYLLDREISMLQKRCIRACISDKHAFRYSLRLRLCTLEGAKCKFMTYIKHRAKVLDKMHEELTGLEHQLDNQTIRY